MQTANLSESTLGDIAATHPGAIRVFLRHELDFCCGGRRRLADACAAVGLEPDELVAEIIRESESPTDARWDRAPISDLADHIEQRYHAALRRDVPGLIAAARRVERVHAGKPAVPSGLADHLERVWLELQAHMQKEEEALFPMLRRGARGQAIYAPVRVLEAEHDNHGADLAQIRALTGDLAVPPHACATWAALYDGLEHLERELMEHIHLENNILFLRAARGDS